MLGCGKIETFGFSPIEMIKGYLCLCHNLLTIFIWTIYLNYYSSGRKGIWGL